MKAPAPVRAAQGSRPPRVSSARPEQIPQPQTQLNKSTENHEWSHPLDIMNPPKAAFFPRNSPAASGRNQVVVSRWHPAAARIRARIASGSPNPAGAPGRPQPFPGWQRNQASRQGVLRSSPLNFKQNPCKVSPSPLSFSSKLLFIVSSSKISNEIGVIRPRFVSGLGWISVDFSGIEFFVACEFCDFF